MSYGVYGWVVWGAFVMLSALVMFVYGWRSGQFRKIEEPKYRMLEDREPAPWPGREPVEPPEDTAETAKDAQRAQREDV